MTTAAFILALAVAVLILMTASVLAYRRFGLSGRVLASDAGVARRTRVLRSARYGVSGKPDYLVEERGVVVPVELKPRRRSDRPRLRDVVQVAAYCLLLEEIEPRFGGYGYLRYAGRTFRIDFTDSLRTELLRTLASMRADLGTRGLDPDPDHGDAARCARCPLVPVCGRPLTGGR